MSSRISTRITPEDTLDVLSQFEVAKLIDKGESEIYETFRRCALAVLNTGAETDDTKAVLDTYKDFAVKIIQQERGIKLELINAPDNAFVDGEMLKGIKEHVFAALRDIVYINNELKENRDLDLGTTEGITNGVFHIVRNAGLLEPELDPNLIVCWGGHSINEVEYSYSKETGYQMGLRGLDICTGCGPGAMKGPMKGATFGHAKQRRSGRYIGLTEPGIIAAESPNPIVNNLVILPDIEKRLEAFVRLGHGIVVFPGGVGTAEEILYILGVLLQAENKNVPFPLVFTGPESAEAYFAEIHNFIGATLGEEAQKRYKIIIDDPVEVAQYMKSQMQQVKDYRRLTQDAYYFNWVMKVPDVLQFPFQATHESMAALNLSTDQDAGSLAANLRKAFSGIVDGNVRESGIREVEKHGPFKITGDDKIMKPLDGLLRNFVAQKRMKIPTSEYIPCYELV